MTVNTDTEELESRVTQLSVAEEKDVPDASVQEEPVPPSSAADDTTPADNVAETAIPNLQREPYKPGKTARRTARRNAAKKAALAALEAQQLNEDGTVNVDAPPLRLEVPEEETLTLLEEDEQENVFDVAFNPSTRVETAATAFIKRGKTRKISQRQQNLLRSFLKHGGIKLQKPVDPKAAKKAEEVVDLDELPSMNCDDDVFDSDEDVTDDEGEDVDMAELAQQKVVDSDPDSDSESNDEDYSNSDEGDDPGSRQVDFYAVTASWLSDFIMGPESKFVDMADICEAPRVCEAFLIYMLLRKVVPEFEDEIRDRCLPLVKQAQEELPLCKDLSCTLPGYYNMACSVRFGGEYSTLMDLDEDDSFDATTTGTGAPNANGSFGVENVVTVDGVNIEVPRMNAPSEPIEGWGDIPEATGTVQRQWKEEANTEAVMGITRRQVYRLTAAIFLKSIEGDTAEEQSSPPTQLIPTRFSTFARVVEVAPIPESSAAETLDVRAISTFYAAKLKFVEDAEEDVKESDGLVAEIWFEPAAIAKLRVGMLIDAMFHKLPTGDWFMDQVAFVLPSYTQDAFY